MYAVFMLNPHGLCSRKNYIYFSFPVLTSYMYKLCYFTLFSVFVADILSIFCMRNGIEWTNKILLKFSLKIKIL